VAMSAAPDLKRVTLELGGNDPAIVLPGTVVDDKLIETLFWAAYGNSGQWCIAVKRLYVHDSLYDDFLARFVAFAEDKKVGNGMDPTTDLGPIQNKMQYDKLKGMLAEAREQGKVLAGGDAIDRPGYFIAPTIVRDIPDSARLVSGFLHGALLHAGDPARNGDDDSRLGQVTAAVHLLDEVPEHPLGDVEVGDDAVLQRAHRDDVSGRAADHPLGLDADGDDLPGIGIERDDRRFVEHDAAAPDVHQGVGCAEVDCHVTAQKRHRVAHRELRPSSQIEPGNSVFFRIRAAGAVVRAIPRRRRGDTCREGR